MVSKSFIFLVKSVLGHFFQTFGDFLLVTLHLGNIDFPVLLSSEPSYHLFEE